MFCPSPRSTQGSLWRRSGVKVQRRLTGKRRLLPLSQARVTSKDDAIPLRNIKCRCASPSGQANRDQFVPFGLRRESAMVEADKSAGKRVS